MGGCLHDRLLTVGVFYSQQKQAIDDTLASSRSDTAGTETRQRETVLSIKHFLTLSDSCIHDSCNFIQIAGILQFF